MFPIAHGWLLARLTDDGSPTPAAFLGCVWPDMLFGSPLTHKQSHTSGEALLDFARDGETYLAICRAGVHATLASLGL
ncbi:MAG: hypothetical protein KGO05_14785 [Chloroflexota bacterium]|nr:hypothetical protein [Chloroflexota bacterium]